MEQTDTQARANADGSFNLHWEELHREALTAMRVKVAATETKQLQAGGGLIGGVEKQAVGPILAASGSTKLF